MRRTVFADAVYYFALLNERDQYTPRAIEFTHDYRGRFVTTTAVLSEAGNSLSGSDLRTASAELADLLQRSPRVEIVGETPQLWDEALRLYAGRPDKHWSLTDCMSFLVMQDRGLTEALPADRHFEQAGFTILLK